MLKIQNPKKFWLFKNLSLNIVSNLGFRISDLSDVFILLLFFLLPVGWSKHWLIPENLVNGVLVDYLMPDLWLQDIIALAIIILNFKFIILKLKFLLPLFLILGSVFFSSAPLVSLINLTRFLLALGVGHILTSNRKFKKPALIGLTGAVIWTGILAILQFIKQGTVFGWWFLGEPIFSLGSGGVKKVVLFGKNLVLPMATFPHFNVLIAFLILSLIVLRKKIWYWLAAALVLFKVITFDSTSFWRRWQLIKISLAMIKDYPLFGVGWGCFVEKLPDFWHQLGTNFRFLQPVHNIFLIMLSELGFLGSLGIILLISRFCKGLLSKKYFILYTFNFIL